jgi:biopolymer transport protein ExbB
MKIIKNDPIELKAEPLVIIEKSLEAAPMTAAKPAIAEKQELAGNIPMTEQELAQLEAEVNGADEKSTGVMIDLGQVFSGSPTIYTVLILLSVGSFCIWLYTLFTLRTGDLIPAAEVKAIRDKLLSREYDEALAMCQQSKNILFQMVASGIESRSHGQTVMVDTMKSEGRRASSGLWQKIALLNDVAMIAPMLGLLGTVLGMFYAFYDLNRSMESISALFDGLGVSVGTTVCGLIVAILAMIFHAVTKYRLVRQLTLIENEAQTLANLIDTKE